MIFSCTPVKKAWKTDEPGSCLPVGATFYGLAIFTIVCDVVIIFLPIPLLLRLNIKTAQKAGVVCLFLLGLFTTICSILRLTQIHRVAFGDGNSTMLVLWGTIEFNVGVCFLFSFSRRLNYTNFLEHCYLRSLPRPPLEGLCARLPLN